MNWNTHSNLRGAHAFLGASKYHWLNYDDKKLRESYLNALAVKRGTELHDFAATCIRLKQKLPKSAKTLNAYVNDAIGYDSVFQTKKTGVDHQLLHMSWCRTGL